MPTIVQASMTMLTFVALLSTGASRAYAAAASTSSLQSSSNPSNLSDPVTLSHAVTLTATVFPSTATGKVAFFDGVSPLGVAVLFNGKATFTTTLPPSGTRALRALYAGDGAYPSSTSAVLNQAVSALAQKGFLPAVPLGGISFPRAIVVADFNGDGIADLAVPDFDINQMSVLLGKGDGTFRAAVSYKTEAGPTDIVTADFNGDGYPDIAVANGATPANSVSVFINRGDGTFLAAVNYSIGTPNTLVNPEHLAVADFNGDGAADLVLIANKTVLVLLGNGNGTFQAPVSYTAGPNPLFLAVGDLNGDGRLDVITTSTADDSVNVLLGKGNGTFQTAVPYSAPKGVQGVAIGDSNGDGRLDLVVAEAGSNNVSVLPGNGDGTLHAAVPFGIVPVAYFVAVGDFNKDGRSDLAVANFGPGAGISILLGVAASPSPLITKVANAEGESPTIAPNTWVEIKGTGLGPATGRILAGSGFCE